jgi:AraC family transcriptional regulator, arabinose operon regulatory protein
MSESIYTMNYPPYQLPFIVIGIGFEDNQPHIYRKDGHNTHQIFLCKRGEGTLKLNDKTYIITKNMYFYLEPNVFHEYYGNTEFWELVWISFSGNYIMDTLNELKFNTSMVGLCDNSNRLQALFHKVYVTLKTDESYGNTICSNLLYEILIDLSINSQIKLTNTNSKSYSITDRVKSYIDDHYAQELTIDELAELVKITPQHLCRIFKNYLNMRPFEYLAMKRMQQAKNLLSNTKLSVNEISQTVGYHDCSYFCYLFKKYEMISPSEFRGLKFIKTIE